MNTTTLEALVGLGLLKIVGPNEVEVATDFTIGVEAGDPALSSRRRRIVRKLTPPAQVFTLGNPALSMRTTSSPFWAN